MRFGASGSILFATICVTVGTLASSAACGDSSAGRSVDVPPATTITDGPSERSNETTADFSFECDGEESCTFECRLDYGGWSSCESPTSYEDLSVGEHTFEARAVEEGRAGDADGRSWTIETDKPVVEGLAGPESPTAETAATFEFACSEEQCTYECRLDEGEPQSCESGIEYTELEDGDHTFSVTAIDRFGNESEPASLEWRIDTVNPLIEQLEGPADPTNDTSASFAFSCSKDECTYACGLDDGDLEECAPGVSYEGLGEGTHTFRVRAADSLGNEGPESTYEWRIDTEAPAVEQLEGPDSPTDSTSATLEFSCSEDECSYECDLDGQGFDSCASGVSYDDLEAGEHVVDIRATDPAGNTGEVSTHAWVVDTEAPAVTDLTGPENPTNIQEAVFEFGCSEASCSFQCNLDGGGFESCTSGVTYANLADGEHTVAVRATDEAGNTGSESTYTWRVDTQAPSVENLTGPPDPTNSTSAMVDFGCSESNCTYTCELDGQGRQTCSPQQTFTNLSPGQHVVTVRATDEAGNTSTGTSYQWTVDTDPPSVENLGGPSDPTNQTSATLNFGCSEGGCSYECDLDGQGFQQCSPGEMYSGLAEGGHTVSVRATDPAGNTGTLSSYTWEVDTTAPSVGKVTGPSDPTNKTAATFDFDCSESNCSYECELDGQGYQSCSSGKLYAGLSDGSHSFSVRPIDEAGNTGNAQDYSWTVDTQEPSVQNVTGPSDPTNQTSATFDFSCSESNCTYECDLDGQGFKSCSPGKTYSGLAEGPHAFQVRATDEAGNTGSAEIYTWEVDTTAPSVENVTGPSDPTSKTSATIDFGCSESGCDYECNLDGQGFQSCAPPTNYSGLGDGSHTVEVRATDEAGNTGNASSYSWTVDTQPPSVTNVTGPSDPTNQTSATFDFSCSESNCTYECDLDGQGFSSCSPGVGYSGLSDGSHTFEVRATDQAGNTGDASSYTWTVDTQAPSVENLTGPSDPTNQTSADFDFSCSESGCSYECDLDGQGFQSCSPTVSYSGLSDGSHTFEVRATDQAGNTSSSSTYSWTVDTQAPSVENLTGPSDPTNQTSADFDFSCSESGCSYECDLDGQGFQSCSPTVSYSGLSDGSHTFAVRATDEAGNTGTEASYTWEVDTQAPTIDQITGPTDPTNDTSATFDFSCSESSCTYECDLDGQGFSSCSPGVTYSGLSDGSHTFEVRATDDAGNTGNASSYTWTVDTQAPSVENLTGPPDPSDSTSASFDFGCSESGCTYECDLDGQGYSSCSPTVDYTGLSNATHTFSVRATDQAGNTGSETSYTWTIEADAYVSSISNRTTYNRSGGGWTGEGSGVSISEDRGDLAVWDDYSTDLKVIDLSSGSVEGVYSTGGGGDGKGLDYSPDGTRLFAVNNNGDWLAKIDTSGYSTMKSVDPPGGDGCDVRVISSDRLVVGTSSRVLLYDHNLNLIDSASTSYAGFLSYDDDAGKVYASGAGYHASTGLARVDLSSDTLTVDWEESKSANISGVFPLDDVFLQLEENGNISVRSKSTRSTVNSYSVGQLRRTPGAKLSDESVVMVDTNNGDVIQYRESNDSFNTLGTAMSGTTNGTEVTENYFSIYWNSGTDGVELWDVSSSF